MSQSSLKLKKYEVFNILKYFDIDDALTEEESIVDLIYENSLEDNNILTFTLILTKGRIIYIEYNTYLKKLTKIYNNLVLTSIISNSITICELHHSAPIILATSLNEIIYVDSKSKPQQILTLTEENVNIYSSLCCSEIISLKSNCNLSLVLVITVDVILIYKLSFDKIENTNCLDLIITLKSNFFGFYLNENSNNNNNSLSYSYIYNKSLFIDFSSYNQTLILATYALIEPVKDCKLKPQNISLDKGAEINVYLANINVHKKNCSIEYLNYYQIDNSLLCIKYSLFKDKVFFLLNNGLISIVKNISVKSLSLTKDATSNQLFNKAHIYKYCIDTDITFKDLFVHSTGMFILVKDFAGSFLVFDYTLNLYYIINDSVISVKLDLQFYNDKSYNTSRSNDNKHLIENSIDNNLNNFKLDIVKTIYINNTDIYSSTLSINNKLGINSTISINDYDVDNNLKSALIKERVNDNLLYLYDSKYLYAISLEVNTSFNYFNKNNTLSNDKINNNVIKSNTIDDFQLLKNNLRGNNFECSIRILNSIDNYNLYIQSLLFIINKLSHNSTNILLVKRNVLSDLFENIKEKDFFDENKNLTLQTIKTLAFTNLIYRCLSIKQYEYAFLIADKLSLNYLFKLILAHAKQTKFLGIAYLCCHKIDENQSENDDNIVNDINKIIASSNFVMSQQNVQNLLKDIEFLLENDDLNNNYTKEKNTLGLDLNKYMEALNYEMQGKFNQAKEIYKNFGLNYDCTRVQKLYEELSKHTDPDDLFDIQDID